MTDKTTTVAEAVQRLVKNGDYLAIGGFGTNRLPTAVVHEILRQPVEPRRSIFTIRAANRIM